MNRKATFLLAISAAVATMWTGCCSTTVKKPTGTPTSTASPTPTGTFTPTPTNTWAPIPTPTAAQYVYIYGGDNLTNSFSAAYSAPILPGGNLGSWTSTNPLPKTISQFAYCFGGGYAFLIGGESLSGGGTMASWTVYYAPMNGGTLGPWQQASPVPVGYMFFCGAAIAQNRLWAWDDGWGDTFSAPLTSGLPGAWTATTPVPPGMHYNTGGWGSDGSYLYTAGGINPMCTPQSLCITALADPSGSVSP